MKRVATEWWAIVAIALGVLLVSGVGSPVLADSDDTLVDNCCFEGGWYAVGVHMIPNLWTLFETFSGGGPETSIISVIADNGPGCPGDSCVHWLRTNGGASGDWTCIEQDLDIDVISYGCLCMLIDVKVLSHNLEAGGWTAPRWEYPVTVIVYFTDTSGVNRYWQFGWWDWMNPANPPPDDVNGLVVDGGAGIVFSRQVVAGQWYAESFSLVAELSKLAPPQHIYRIRVGGTGWDFEGQADNVCICGCTAVEEASWAKIKAMFR